MLTSMDSSTTRIHARSERQAMDWSLVLVSQGIETTIEFCAESARWELVVPARDGESAFKALRQYRIENRGWPWQQPVFHSGLLFDWGCLAWVFVLSLFYLLDAQHNLRAAGHMDSSLAAQGQWWRLFTAVWLHADLAHLATNSAIGLLLLGFTLGRYGTGIGLLAAYLTGAGGNLLAWGLASQPHHSLGASGMVMGSLGLLATQSVAHWRQNPPSTRHAISSLLGGLMLFVLLGLTPGTDVSAHLGGFLSGLFLGGLLAFWPDSAAKAKTNLLCGLCFTLLVIWPWWLALHRS